jgi:hypothetical protein
MPVSSRLGMGQAYEVDRPIGDVVVQAATPADLVAGGACLKGCDVAIGRHGTSLAGRPGGWTRRGIGLARG